MDFQDGALRQLDKLKIDFGLFKELDKLYSYKMLQIVKQIKINEKDLIDCANFFFICRIILIKSKPQCLFIKLTYFKSSKILARLGGDGEAATNYSRKWANEVKKNFHCSYEMYTHETPRYTKIFDQLQTVLE